MHKNAIIPFIVIIGFLAAGVWIWQDFSKLTNLAAVKVVDQTATSKESDLFSSTASNPAVQGPTQTQQITNIDTSNIMNATFHTNKGDITIELFPQLAPKTVENFVKLAQSGFYDGVKFHRVIADFMIQGGDPLTKDDSMKDRWGTGGPGYTFEDEIHAQNINAAGTISMANAGPNTNGSQFFINTNDNNFLDTKHTVFGQVIEGLEVVDAIQHVKTGAADRPLEPVIINSITLK